MKHAYWRLQSIVAGGEANARLRAAQRREDAYVFDVFRIAGGTRHTYCFHGPINDDFTWNATREAPPAAGTDEAEYLARFSRMPELSLAADSPEHLQATWRMALEVDGTGGGEKEMLGRNYRPRAPRKFTRLHLLGLAGGTRAMRGEIVCQRWGCHFTNLMVRRPDALPSTQSAFVVLVEPYAGEPLIARRRPPVSTDRDTLTRRGNVREFSDHSFPPGSDLACSAAIASSSASVKRTLRM